MPENTPAPDQPGDQGDALESTPDEAAADATVEPTTGSPDTEPGAGEEVAAGAATEDAVPDEPDAAGRRVTRRTIHRRESEETTQETITEDVPLYSGPVSDHPAPVG